MEGLVEGLVDGLVEGLVGGLVEGWVEGRLEVFTRFLGPLVPGDGKARAQTEDAFYAADSADAFAWNTCACC